MPARSGQEYVESLKKQRALRLPGRPAGGRRDRRAGLPGADPRHRRAVRHAARPGVPRRDDLPVADDGRAGVHVVPRALHARGAGEEAQALQAARRPQLRLHGPRARLHEPVRHRLAPHGRPVRPRGRALRRERHALLRARARARPLPHPHADQPADRPSQDLGPAGGPVPAPGPGARDGRRHRRARGQDAGHDGADHRGGRGDPVRRRAPGRRRLRARLRHPDRPRPASSSSAARRCRRCPARASTIRCRAASRRWTASPSSTTCSCRGTA